MSFFRTLGCRYKVFSHHFWFLVLGVGDSLPVLPHSEGLLTNYLTLLGNHPLFSYMQIIMSKWSHRSNGTPKVEYIFESMGGLVPHEDSKLI